MDTLTKTLKKSIEYEQSKSDVMNLTNHKEGDLCVMIEAIEFLMRDYQNELTTKERILNESEDLSYRVEFNLNNSIAWLKNQIQSLLAWRALFFVAIDRVKG